MGYSFDHYADIWGYETIFKKYEEQLGKLFIATVRNDNDTRLFGRSMVPSIDMEDKEGWWNTFTITKKAQQKGTYIVKIVNVRPDKDGYPIFEVDVLLPVDESILVNNPLISLFLASECFNERYRRALELWNVEALKREMSKHIEFPKFVETHVVAAAAVQKAMYGTITLEQIQGWLESPTDEEIRDAQIEEDAKLFIANWRLKDFKPYVDRSDIPSWINDMNRSDSERVEKIRNETPMMDVSLYPHICKKMQNAKDARMSIGAKDFIEWHKSYRWDVRFDMMEAKSGSYLEQIEAYLVHLDARKAAKDAQKEASKAKKTAAKKAKKLAAKLEKERAKAKAEAMS